MFNFSANETLPEDERSYSLRYCLDLSPFLRQTVKAQKSANGMKMPSKGVLSHGFVSTAVHEGVQVGGDSAAGDGSLLVVITEVNDPAYLAAPFWTSTHFKKQKDAAGWNPTPCSAK